MHSLSGPVFDSIMLPCPPCTPPFYKLAWLNPLDATHSALVKPQAAQICLTAMTLSSLSPATSGQVIVICDDDDGEEAEEDDGGTDVGLRV